MCLFYVVPFVILRFERHLHAAVLLGMVILGGSECGSGSFKRRQAQVRARYVGVANQVGGCDATFGVYIEHL